MASKNKNKVKYKSKCHPKCFEIDPTFFSKIGKSSGKLTKCKLHLGLGPLKQINGDFPKWSKTFIELCKFHKFRETDKSLKHELGSI